MRSLLDPREVVEKLPFWLAKTLGVQFEYGVLAREWDGRTLATSAGRLRAERCFVCSGDELQVLFPDALSALALRRCKLQMMRTDPVDWRLGALLAAGLTLLHYDAFASCPSRGALEQRLVEDYPDHLRFGIHVMASQTASGELTLGDSHVYDDAVTPFDDELIDGLVLDYLRGFLDTSGVQIACRWHGVLRQASDETVLHRAGWSMRNGDRRIWQRRNDAVVWRGRGGCGRGGGYGVAAFESAAIAPKLLRARLARKYRLSRSESVRFGLSRQTPRSRATGGTLQSGQRASGVSRRVARAGVAPT